MNMIIVRNINLDRDAPKNATVIDLAVSTKKCQMADMMLDQVCTSGVLGLLESGFSVQS